MLSPKRGFLGRHKSWGGLRPGRSASDSWSHGHGSLHRSMAVDWLKLTPSEALLFETIVNHRPVLFASSFCASSFARGFHVPSCWGSLRQLDRWARLMIQDLCASRNAMILVHYLVFCWPSSLLKFSDKSSDSIIFEFLLNLSQSMDWRETYRGDCGFYISLPRKNGAFLPTFLHRPIPTAKLGHSVSSCATTSDLVLDGSAHQSDSLWLGGTPQIPRS